MLCDECGKNPASVHLTKIINGKINEIHLCEGCAKHNKDFDPSFSIHNFLTGLLDSTHDGPVKVDYIQGTQCEKCGMTYGKFRQTGKFGCRYCYESFSEKLKPLFKSIHGHDFHTGKVPQKAGGTIKIRKEIDKLKETLERAVKKEDFEKAAVIRDKIKELQKDLRN